MAFPDDLDVNSLSREQVINLLLASIGFEELALAHLVKSQADLIRIAVDNGNGEDCRLVRSVNDLLEINRSVNRTLRIITNKERILLLKLREVADLIEKIPPLIGNCCTAMVETGEAVIDAAYINGETIGFGVNVDKIDISIGSNCKTHDNRIDLRFIKDACSFITITLVGETGRITCDPEFNRAFIRATVNVQAANNQLAGEYTAFITINDNGDIIVFLENERNRILFRITGTESEVEECPDGCAGAAACECSVNITTNQNTTITITGDNVFGNGIIRDFFIDIPCNCEAADSSLSILISNESLQILITGEFEEGTIVTGCEGDEASILGSVILGDDSYDVSIQANRDGIVTAIFAGASDFTISLTGANVLISDCINSF